MAAPRRRGVAPAVAVQDDDDEAADAACDKHEQKLEAAETPAQLAKKAKISALWEQMQGGKGGGGSATATATAKPAAAAVLAPASGKSKAPVNLAALCRPITKKKQGRSDLVRVGEGTWVANDAWL